MKIKHIELKQEEVCSFSCIKARTKKGAPLRLIRVPPDKNASDYYGEFLVETVGVSPKFMFLDALPSSTQIFTYEAEKKFNYAVAKYPHLLIVLKSHFELPDKSPMQQTRFAQKGIYTGYKILVNSTGKTLAQLKLYDNRTLKLFVNPNYVTPPGQFKLSKARARKMFKNGQYAPPLIERLITNGKRNKKS